MLIYIIKGQNVYSVEDGKETLICIAVSVDAACKIAATMETFENIKNNSL